MRTRPSSHGPPPRPPITGIDTAFATAAPASGPEWRKSSIAAPAASSAFASLTSSATGRWPWNSANTSMPALTSARTRSAEASTLTISAPPSSTSRFASSTEPDGTSQLRSARFTPRRTALQTISISPIVTGASAERPQRFVPTESPTETMSTPARSAIAAICASHATTATILRAWRFISRSAAIVMRSMSRQYTKRPMIIDIHGHYTTEPQKLLSFRDKQLAGLADAMRKPATSELGITDEELVASVQPQLKLQKERGSDLTIFSPRAAGMAHHVGTEATGIEWTRMPTDLIHRICNLLPENFAPVGQLPQHPGVPPKNCIAELERLAKLGFVGVNLNPDPAGGYWTDPPLTDKGWWYPLYEKLAELEMTAMIHVTSSCNPVFHYTGAHYINGDTTAFMQLIQGNVFKDFPTLKFVIPHGGGAVPFHWGRYRGLAIEMKKPPLTEHLLKNVFFDTCVYHQAGIDCMAKVIPVDNILFASEMLGAVKGVDLETGHNYDDTKRYIDKLQLSSGDRVKIFEFNARRVYPRLDKRLKARKEKAA